MTPRLGLLIFALAGTGCTSARSPMSAPAPAAPPAESPTPLAELELPPEQAAVACRKTAAELEARGYPADAILQYEQARRLDPGRQADVGRRLAVLYAGAGDAERAAAEFEQAIAREPSSAGARADYGVFLAERSDLAGAERELREALRLDPARPGAWANLGTVVAKAGRAEEAEAAFARAVSPADAAYNVGVILAGAGRTDEAKSALRRAAEAGTPSPRAAELLKRLDGGSDVGAR